jgi:predicted Zn-dependent protease
MLVPVIGLVQVGAQARADRYTYLPSIGIFVIVAWGLGAFVRARPRYRSLAVGTVIAALLTLAVVAQRQVLVWRNTRSLFTHCAAVTRDNYRALSVLAKVDLDDGNLDEAMSEANAALKTMPQFAEAEYVIATALQQQGKMQESMPHLLAARGFPEVRIPSDARLVLCYLDAGQLASAETTLQPLERAMPGEPNAVLMRAALLRGEGRVAEARQLFGALMARHPKFMLDNPTLNFELAELYSLQGENSQAARYYLKAIELSPALRTR